MLNINKQYGSNNLESKDIDKTFLVLYETIYSRTDQVQYVEDNF